MRWVRTPHERGGIVRCTRHCRRRWCGRTRGRRRRGRWRQWRPRSWPTVGTIGAVLTPRGLLIVPGAIVADLVVEDNTQRGHIRMQRDARVSADLV
eukprot:scaffold72310_cov63-Phaeocystis_antarctica.AAC.2